jgi:4-hydroxybenzoyl-CoA thioesterase
MNRALGITDYEMTRKYGTIGCPMVETSARFILPSKFGDDVVIESAITEFGRSSFKVAHRLYNGSNLAIEAFETRIWAKRHPEDPSRIKAAPIPAEVKERFERG